MQSKMKKYLKNICYYKKHPNTFGIFEFVVDAF